MPRSNLPLDTEWESLRTVAEHYIDTVQASGRSSARAKDSFLSLIGAINSLSDLLAIRAQGMPCPDLRTLRIFRIDLERLQERVEDPRAWRTLKERIRRELQPYRHAH